MMYMKLVLPVLLAFALTQEVQSFLRKAGGADTAIPGLTDNPLGDLGDAVGKAGDAVGKQAKDAADTVQKGPGEEKKEKKDMDPIEQMRAMMCWGRKKLMDHEDCMTWLVRKCNKETSGEGYCKKLRRYVKSKCKRGSAKGCDYAKQLGIDVATDTEVLDAEDLDGDGVKDVDDAFPDNPNESTDSDGDGVGDNEDKYPNDPSCSKEGDVCGGPSPAPSASPAGAPSPMGLNMDESVPLPSQGYNEHSSSYVAHDDGKTMTRDWRSEWPMGAGDEEDSIKSICDKNPDHPWCKLKTSAKARQAYRLKHP